MKKLNLEDLHDLGVGCSILGSGGGSYNELPCLMAQMQMAKSGPVSLINYSELKPDDVVIAIGFIGAPSVEVEKLASGREFEYMFDYVKKSMNKKISVIMPFEIGGGNGIFPMIEAARLNLPILDADMMGRAFPEAQMSSYNIFRKNLFLPGFITDCHGNTTIIHAATLDKLEKIGRQICIAMGSIAAFGFFPMGPEQIQKYTIPKSVSKALSLGEVSRKARSNGKDPIQAILKLCNGVKLGSGKITDIDRSTDKGFLHGVVTVQNKSDVIELEFKNEFLIAKCNGEVIATTPDILTLLEQGTGNVINAQSLEFGLNVHVVVLPAPPIWTTSEGLELVGPRNFRYEFDYYPFVGNKHVLSLSKELQAGINSNKKKEFYPLNK